MKNDEEQDQKNIAKFQFTVHIADCGADHPDTPRAASSQAAQPQQLTQISEHSLYTPSG